MKLCLFAILMVAVSFYGCSEDPVASNSNNSGLGTLVGKVYIYDAFANWVPNQTGVTVTLEGTSYTTTSDSTGIWTITNIPSGTYVVVYSKSGYVSKKVFNIIVADRGTYYLNTQYSYHSILPNTDYLSAKNLVLRPFEDKIINYYADSIINKPPDSTYTIKVLRTRIEPMEVTTFSFRLYSDLDPSKYMNKIYNLKYMLLFSRDSTSDYKGWSQFKYSSSLNWVSVPPVSLNDTSVSITIEKKFLLRPYMNFTAGERIYVMGVVMPQSFDSYYDDPTNQKTIPPGISPNHTEIRGFVIP